MKKSTRLDELLNSFQLEKNVCLLLNTPEMGTLNRRENVYQIEVVWKLTYAYRSNKISVGNPQDILPLDTIPLCIFVYLSYCEEGKKWSGEMLASGREKIKS